MIMLTLHNDVESQVLVTIHALSEEFAGCLLGNSDIILRNMIILTLHDNVHAQVFVAVHAGSEESCLWLHSLLLEGLLGDVVVLTFHDYVHAKVFIAIHSVGEEGLRTLEFFSNLLLNLLVFLGTFVQFIVLAFKVGVLLLHSLQLLLINVQLFLNILSLELMFTV